MAEPFFMSDTAMSMIKAEWVCTNFRHHGECSELCPLCWLPVLVESTFAVFLVTFSFAEILTMELRVFEI